MDNIINFCEAFENSKDSVTFDYMFHVSYRKHFKNVSGIFLRVFNVNDYTQTIKLDQEDLNYLYNKYYSKYKEAVIERDEKLKIAKQKEIAILEEKLKKLKDGE